MNRREKEYWHNRIAAAMSEGERERETAKIYSSQYKAIEEELLTLLEIGKKQEITKRSELYKLSHFQSLLKSLKRQNKEIKESVNKETASAIKNALSGAIARSEKAFGVSFKTEQKEELLSGVFKTKWSGKSFSERIWRNTDALSKRVESDVITSIVTGASRETLTKAIMKDYNASFNDADRLIRTETAHAVNQAQADIYEAEGIKEVEWSAGKGKRMCEICKRLDGKRFNVKNAPLLAHPNCRCALLPVIPKDWTPKTLKSVDNSAKSGIIKETGYTKPKINAEDIPSMDKKRFNKIKTNLEKNGIKVIQDSEGDSFLKAMNAEAMTLSDGSAVIFQSHKVPSASACFEEIIHITQIRNNGMISSVGTDNAYIEYLHREIEANEKVLRYSKAYGLTELDKKSVQINLNGYKQKLKEVE